MAKIKHNHFLDTVDSVLTEGKTQGALLLYTEDEVSTTGRQFTIKGKSRLNFGTTSYLALGHDERLKDGAIKAIQNHGTQFPLSKAYLSCSIYNELETLIGEMYGHPVLITKNASMAHISVIPSVVGDDDLVIIDHQVHASVQNAVQLLKPRGIPVEMIRHNRADLLEQKIKEEQDKYDYVWFMIDGVYSMYGDTAPLMEIVALMDKYPKLKVYVDDVHGMSWKGVNGQGFVQGEIGHLHERMILCGTMSKVFGASGAFVVFPDHDQHRKISTFGGPNSFSAQLDPATLGAAVASAKIHLSPEIYELQIALKKRIDFFNELLEQTSLPLINANETPIFFIGTATPSFGYKLMNRLLEQGFYVNVGVFPAVPVKNTGLRITISLYNEMEDIQALFETLHLAYYELLEKEDITLEKIYKNFKIEPKKIPAKSEQADSILTCKLYRSITEINKDSWNEKMYQKGMFDYDALLFWESTFSQNSKKEENWDFYYIEITDGNKPLLYSVLTHTIWKKDIFSLVNISKQIEEKRKKDPYYLTSEILTTGTFATEGEHFYIDLESKHSDDLITLFLNEVEALKDKLGVESLLLRDFFHIPTSVTKKIENTGFLKINIPEFAKFSLNNKWDTIEEYKSLLSYNARKNFKASITKYTEQYKVRIKSTLDSEERGLVQKFYNHVKSKNIGINIFDYPEKLFHNINESPLWECIMLYILDDKGEEKLAAGVYCYKGNGLYCGFVVGLNYELNEKYRVYQNVLFNVIKRGKELGVEETFLGFSAAFEKKRFGCNIFHGTAYLQDSDNFQLEAVEMSGH